METFTRETGDRESKFSEKIEIFFNRFCGFCQGTSHGLVLWQWIETRSIYRMEFQAESQVLHTKQPPRNLLVQILMTSDWL